MRILTKDNLTPDELAELEKIFPDSEDEPYDGEVIWRKAPQHFQDFMHDFIHGPGNTKKVQMKLHPDLLKDIQELAYKNGYGYITYIKKVLEAHVLEMKKNKEEPKNP